MNLLVPLMPFFAAVPIAVAAVMSSVVYAQQPATGTTARIIGLVIDEKSAPIENATVVLDRKHQRQTDATGRFHFDSLSPGTHQLAARSIGYSPLAATLELAAGTADAVITLHSSAYVLPELSVKARQFHLDKVGYYDRRSEEDGRFLEADTLLSLDSMSLLRSLSRVPGLRLRNPAALDPDIASHACLGGFRLWLNGHEIPDANKGYFLRIMLPEELEAVEIYEAKAPLTFAGYPRRSCVLAIWKR